MGENKKTCEQLISQLMRYKTNVAPYNMLYDNDSNSPLTWWMTCEDNYNHLQSIAIKIFNEIALSIKNDSDSDDSLIESEIQEEESTDYDLQELVKRMLDIENDYESNYYKNDYESNSENYNEDDENDNKSNNSLDIENDNSDNSDNNQTAKITNFFKTHNLRKRKYRQSKE